MCVHFSLGENVLTVFHFQRRTIYTNMGTVQRKFYSELWKVDVFLNPFHCFYPNLRIPDICYHFGKPSAAQWRVHFVIWLLATKCSLVFKYMLRFTGNLKKKLVADSDYPSFLSPSLISVLPHVSVTWLYLVWCVNKQDWAWTLCYMCVVFIV